MTARAAAGWLMILGGVVIVAISVGSAWYAIANPQWIDRQLAGIDPALREQLAGVLSRDVILELVIACGVGGVLEGGLSIGLGAYVLRGARWAISMSVAVTLLRLALAALLLLATLVDGTTMTEVDVWSGGVRTSTSNNPIAPSSGTATTASLLVATAVLVATLALLYRARRAMPPTLPVARVSNQ